MPTSELDFASFKFNFCAFQMSDYKDDLYRAAIGLMGKWDNSKDECSVLNHWSFVLKSIVLRAFKAHVGYKPSWAETVKTNRISYEMC
jgi:hypothetical protein